MEAIADGHSVSPDIRGLRFKAIKNIKRSVAAGTSYVAFADIDGFADVPAGGIVMAVPIVSASWSDTDRVRAWWNTYGGSNRLAIYSPNAQDVFFNLVVFWSA